MMKLRKQSFFKMFTSKRKSRGPFWASLIGLGVSAAVFGVTRGKRKNLTPSFQNFVKNFTPPRSNVNLMDNAALTEFSEELLQSALTNKHEEK